MAASKLKVIILKRTEKGILSHFLSLTDVICTESYKTTLKKHELVKSQYSKTEIKGQSLSLQLRLPQEIEGNREKKAKMLRMANSGQ